MILTNFTKVCRKSLEQSFAALFAFCLMAGIGIVSISALAQEQRPDSRYVKQSHSIAVPPGLRESLGAANSLYQKTGVSASTQLKLPIKSGTVEVSLEPHDIRAAGYRSEETSFGIDREAPVSVKLFRGQVITGRGKGSKVRLADINTDGVSRLDGLLTVDSELYRIREKSLGTLQVEELDSKELHKLIAQCGLPHAEQLSFNVQSARTSQAVSISADSFRLIDVATEADYEFVQAEGGASAANASILSILNSVDAIYQNQLGLTLAVSYQHAWSSSSDPYSTTDSSALLGQFYNYWEANYRSGHNYDVAHLWTGRDLDSSVVGVAYLGAVCQSFSYGLSQRLGNVAYDIPLTAHEMGHNLGANHDSCSGSQTWLMCPFLVAGATQFSTTSKSSISSYLGTVDCLTTTDPPSTNAPPVLSGIGAQSVNENETLSFSLAATDSDGDTLSYSASGIPSGATLVGTTFTYTPGYSVVSGGSTTSSLTVTFTVSDGQGGTDSEAVVLTVNNVNRSPSISNQSVSVNEGELLSYQIVASDPDDDSLGYRVSSALPGGLTLSGAGVFSWRPGGNQSGVYVIPIQVVDVYGDTASANLTVTVVDVGGILANPTTLHTNDSNGTGRSDLMLFRSSSGIWLASDTTGDSSSSPFGLYGDIPVPADYNGDHITDIAVFRPSNSTWYILFSGSGVIETLVYGTAGDIPAPADFDGDGRADLAVYRPVIATFFYRHSLGQPTTVTTSVGASGDLPVPCDYDGDGVADIATFRPSNGLWTILSATPRSVAFGVRQDLPVAADYDGNGTCDVSVFRPTTGEWFLNENETAIVFGSAGDLPAPGDYDGDGDIEPAVYNPFLLRWYQYTGGSPNELSLGATGDSVPLVAQLYYASRMTNRSGSESLSEQGNSVVLYRPKKKSIYLFGLESTRRISRNIKAGTYLLRGDYDGDSILDTITFRDGRWLELLSTGSNLTATFGARGDRPVVGDIDGDGRADRALYRPSTNQLLAELSANGQQFTKTFSESATLAVVGDVNGDGWSDVGTWRKSDGKLVVYDSRSGVSLINRNFGAGTSVVRLLDFDNDGRADLMSWNQNNGGWTVELSSGSTISSTLGRRGDIPLPGAYISTSALDFAVYRPSNKTLYVRSQAGSARSRAYRLSKKEKKDKVIGSSPLVPLNF